MRKRHYYKGEPMDMLHTVAFKEMHPIISCIVKLSSPINVNRLKKAVELTSVQIPEILCHYQPGKNRWVYSSESNHTVVIQLGENDDLFQQPVDFLKDTQLKIFIKNIPEPIIYMVMSHIFTDGSGFKQFLYLLANNYNHKELASNFHNQRSSESIIKVLLGNNGEYKSKMDLPDHVLTIPFTNEDPILKKFVDYVGISKDKFLKINQRVKKYCLTINDVIMAAYIITLSRETKLTKISIPCPTDLRQFSTSQSLRIANLTGEYGLIISVENSDNIFNIAQKIHNQIMNLKSKKTFLQSIPKLQSIYHKLPVFFVHWIISKHYHVQSVSYTNFGILDRQFYFEDNTILHCLLTGSFRKVPQFQLAVSTYSGVCTLSFCMIGSHLNKEEGHDIIKNIVILLEKWSQ